MRKVLHMIREEYVALHNDGSSLIAESKISHMSSTSSMYSLLCDSGGQTDYKIAHYYILSSTNDSPILLDFPYQ